ncbi:hypothetical protein AB0N99_21495 [Streptomyces sp. NPDC093272]|uniref:hypothetical protein n=1 Tax=unclassified Streptomyces TaxID=2593676 RepID=UPI00342E751D
MLSDWKPRLVKSVLALIAVLGVAAELIEPLGNALKGQQLLGGSFAALVAFILFDAISESDAEPKEIPGVYVFAGRDQLHEEFREAFESRRIRIDFSGFTMETLLEALAVPLGRMADREVRAVELKLCLIIAHLNLPMGLPGGLVPVPRNGDSDTTGYFFQDSPENRERMREEFTRRNWSRLKEMLNAVQRRNPHLAISCELRESPQTPGWKLYVLNQEKVFTTPYGIERDRIEWRGSHYDILDTKGFAQLYGRARYIGWDLRSKSRQTKQIAELHMEWHRNLWMKLAENKPERPVISDPRWTRPASLNVPS